MGFGVWGSAFGASRVSRVSRDYRACRVDRVHRIYSVHRLVRFGDFSSDSALLGKAPHFSQSQTPSVDTSTNPKKSLKPYELFVTNLHDSL